MGKDMYSMDFWSDDRIFESIDEALEWLETGIDHYGGTMPGSVKLYPYKRRKIDNPNPLEHCLEMLDEEFGHPEEPNWYKPTERLVEAEKEFLKVLAEEYVPYWCERDLKLKPILVLLDGFFTMDPQVQRELLLDDVSEIVVWRYRDNRTGKYSLAGSKREVAV